MTAAVGSAKLETHTPLEAISEEQLKAFLEAFKADAGLQEQLKAAGDADAVVVVAKAAGFVISADELKEAQARLLEDELNGIIGGANQFSTTTKTVGDPAAGNFFR